MSKKASYKVKKALLYFALIFDAFLGFLFGPFLLLCILWYIWYIKLKNFNIESGELIGFIFVIFLIAFGFYMLIGALRFYRLIRGGEIIITEWYPPDVFLPKRGCRIIEKRKLRFLGLMDADEYYLVECAVRGHPLRMAVIPGVSKTGWPNDICFGNVHVIFEGNGEVFEFLELD